MSDRERHTLAAGKSSSVTSLAQPSGGMEASLWESWYARAAPEQQQEMMSLVSRQGILYRHQLPPVPGNTPATQRSQLSSLLKGQVQDLAEPSPVCVDLIDKVLDDRQGEAVARAMGSPDIFLVQGYPGTGKSRVAVEIILQAARRGERVLLLAPSEAAIDRILEAVSTQSSLCPLRCLAAGEIPERLSPCVWRLTLGERSRHFKEEVLPAAQRRLEQSERKERDLAAFGGCWARLGEMAQIEEELAEHLRQVEGEKEGLARSLEEEIRTLPSVGLSGFQQEWQTCQQAYREEQERLRSQQAVFRAERETIRIKQDQLERELAQVNPLLEARHGRRWWTRTWWRSLAQEDLDDRYKELRTRQADLESAFQRLEMELASSEEACEQLGREHCRVTEKLLETELGRRRLQVEEQISLLQQQRLSLHQEWQSLCPAQECARPATISLQAAEDAQRRWHDSLEQARLDTTNAREWLKAVEGTVDQLPERITAWVNLVAATTATILAGGAPGLKEPASTEPAYDLLVMEDAHRVTESELCGVARHARRWILVGEPAAEAESQNLPGPRALAPGRLRPGLFQRLWHLLHPDPRRLPFRWKMQGERLCCRLLSIPSGKESCLESEWMVDRPQIELRILNVPRKPAQLAEVHFPSGMPIAEAKAYLYQELGELPVQATSPALHWSETATQIVLHFGRIPALETTAVELEVGCREIVGCSPSGSGPDSKEGCWHSCRLEFDREHHWTRARAEEWVRARLCLHDLHRTILLTKPYRIESELAHFLSAPVFDGLCEPEMADAGRESHLLRGVVEVVPVPALHDSSSMCSNEGSPAGLRHRFRVQRDGAGLETDLAENRPLDHLPSEVRVSLPRRGLVNYLEALAVVQRLEMLAADPGFPVAGHEWQQQTALHPCPGEGNGSSHGKTQACAALMPVVAVIALYQAQAELLRLLIRRSAILSRAIFSIEVGLPLDFEQRECLIALVSLTRSHSHRAVCYGDSPEALVQAMTRPARGLIIFGDAGTLLRRSQWKGPLEHLDAHASQREAFLIEHLLRHIQGHSPAPETSLIQEGCSV